MCDTILSNLQNTYSKSGQKSLNTNVFFCHSKCQHNYFIVLYLVQGRSTGTCIEKAKSVSDKLLAAQNAGNPLYGVEVPRCDTDGTYAGIQYIGSQ